MHSTTETVPTGPKRRPRDAVATKNRILAAAIEEFARNGYEARIEDISDKAGTNRRMAYHYFGSKDGLYLAALEATYSRLVEVEKTIDVENLAPIDAIGALVDAKVDHFVRYPEFVRFCNVENLQEARHLKNSRRLEEFRSPLIHLISRVLERGQAQGLFRSGVDPLEIYVSIVGLIFYVFSNQPALKAVFKVDFTGRQSLTRRKKLILDLIVSYLKAS